MCDDIDKIMADEIGPSDEIEFDWYDRILIRIWLDAWLVTEYMELRNKAMRLSKSIDALGFACTYVAPGQIMTGSHT